MGYVIIGNSAAGVFAAEAIRELDKVGQIQLITDEVYPAYARCLTSYYLTGQLPEEKMFIRSADFCRQEDIDLHTGQRVVKLNSEKKQIETASGKVFSYDKLLIATGAAPIIPNRPGFKYKGVFGLRTLADAKGILEYAGKGKKAVVVGGGFVALKAAYALLNSGMSVTCLISSGQILSQMLDQEAAGIMAKLLVNRGLTLKYYTDVQEVLGEGPDAQEKVVNGVQLTGGEEIPADVVIIGKGVLPNISFLKASGIQTDHGILVNELMQTNFPDIYAAGDVAQGMDLLAGAAKINAIWPNAAQQGTIAGRNMAGITTNYEGSIAMNSADFFGLSTIAAGLTRVGEPDGYEVIKLFPGENLYRRLVFKGDYLIGYIMVGDTAKAGLLTALIKDKVPLGSFKNELMQGRFRQKLIW